MIHIHEWITLCLTQVVVSFAMSNRTLTRFRVPSAGLALAWLIALGVAAVIDSERIKTRLIETASTGDWSGTPAPDATFVLPVLLLAPFCWLFPTRRPRSHEQRDDRPPRTSIHTFDGNSGITVRWKVAGFMF